MLVIGGAKSGKSSFALEACNSMDRSYIFLATAQAHDKEMEERIRIHRADRNSRWITVEEPVNVTKAIKEHDNRNSVILLDCLTLWLSNLFMRYGDDQEKINFSVEELAVQLSCTRGAVVVVSNEVGCGIVPENSLARKYRDTAGFANQRIAAVSVKVVTVIAGLPVVLKDI